jgi:hypothetical protein
LDQLGAAGDILKVRKISSFYFNSHKPNEDQMRAESLASMSARGCWKLLVKMSFVMSERKTSANSSAISKEKKATTSGTIKTIF